MNNLEAAYFGITRFSLFLPNNPAWVLSSKFDREQYRQVLFDDSRLAKRFDLFFNYAAPIYQSFSERFSYCHIVQYSDVLPAKWQEVLFEAAARFPVIVLTEVTEEQGKGGIGKVMMQMLSRRGATRTDRLVALTRIDDDDLLSADYVDQLSQYVTVENVGTYVSFAKGVAARYDESGFSGFREVEKPFLAAGQAKIGSFDSRKGNFHFPGDASHVRPYLVAPTIVEGKKHAFLWSQHEDQGSKLRNNERHSDQVEERLKNYRRLEDPSSVAAAFPTVSKEEIVKE